MIYFCSLVFLFLLKTFNHSENNYLTRVFSYLFFYSKYIILLIPFVLVYFNPKLLKKILSTFSKIDNEPVYNNIENLMISYFDSKNNNKNKLKINYPKRYSNFNQINNNQQQFNNNHNLNTNYMINNNQQQVNNRNRNNFVKPRHKRNVSESKKKFIASNQRWRCAHCNNLLDNTFEVDHIIALYKGGTNELNNLEALCRNCHGKKTFKEKMGLL